MSIPLNLPSLDVDRPNPARMYDYYLGGYHNLAVDRDAARAAETAYPGVTAAARINRSFLRRAVRYLAADRRIRQFLDLGSGVPTVGNVHEIAHSVDSDARVVYVDNEPVAVKASEMLLQGSGGAAIVHADLRQPRTVLDHPVTRSMLDLGQPVALLMVSVLHFVPDSDDPAGIIAAYCDALASGSYLVVSHAGMRGEAGARSDVLTVYQRSTSPLTLRTQSEVARFFDGLEVVEPGVGQIVDWRPDDEPDEYTCRWRDRLDFTGGVARKP